VVAETRGFPISGADASLGLGWDAAIGFFDTDASGDLREQPASVDGFVRLLGPDADPYFRAARLRVDGEGAVPFDPGFAVGVVLDGSGEVSGATRALPLSRGSTFALPAAAMAAARLAGDGLEVVLCLPPEPELAPARCGV
jgi:mannose-6-phosphate isomerase